MDYDVFFAISQTPVAGRMPNEAQMFRNFFAQLEAADALGYGTAWIAESHLSCEVQKRHVRPVIPHWQGEVGLNVDIAQLAHHAFQRTKRIEIGSAVMNILCNGGPIAAAERVAYAMALHGLAPDERRRLHVGFASGRFDFMNRASGVAPRNAVEEAAGAVWKGKVFSEATEIFLRLLRGDVLASDDVPPRTIRREDFRSDDDWRKVACAAGTDASSIALKRHWTFDALKIVPQDWRRDLLQLVIGSHEPQLQVAANAILPVHVFNLSITAPEQIEATHVRMMDAFHPAGGGWKRRYMPRTTFVFINEQPGLTPASRRQAAEEEARAALSAYWIALEGTVDPQKVGSAASNALIGNADDIADQMVRRFHPEDRLMLWFDFFNHDSDRVIANMEAFMRHVPEKIAARMSS